VIRRPINKNETPFHVNGPLEHGGTKEEIPLSPRAHLELVLSETQQHSPRMTIGREPIPHKLATDFQTPQLRHREVLFNRLLQAYDVETLLA
jgi:hypothetical protein